MSAGRLLTLGMAIGLAVVPVVGGDTASEPWPDPPRIALDTPTYQAPKDPPGDPGAAEEPVPAEPEGALTLRDALALALMRNPGLEAFSWETRAAEARMIQAGKIPNPELDLRVYRLGIPRQSADLDETRSRLVLTQDIELGGKRGRRVDLAEAERDLAEWDYEAKRTEVVTVVAGHFASVLGAQRQVEALGAFVDFLERTRDRIDSLVETGSMRTLERHQVTRQVGLARIDLQRAEFELSAVRFRLASTWGSQSPRFTEAVGDLERVEPVPDLETVIALARESPAVARWDSELARGLAALRLAKADRVPDIRFGAGLRWQESTDERDYLVDLQIALPLFDRRQGDVREARYGMARAKAEGAAAAAESGAGIAEVYYELAESRARRLTLGEEVLPAARAAFEAQRAGFEGGAENVGDLLDARRDLARAEVRLIEALVDYRQALAALEGLVGRNLSATD